MYSCIWLIVHIFLLMYSLYSNITTGCLQLEADLEAMRSARISSSSSAPEWGDRVPRREESWEEVWPTIFKEVLCLKGYPASKVYLHYYKLRLSLHIFYHLSTAMTNANIL